MVYNNIDHIHILNPMLEVHGNHTGRTNTWKCEVRVCSMGVQSYNFFVYNNTITNMINVQIKKLCTKNFILKQILMKPFFHPTMALKCFQIKVYKQANKKDIILCSFYHWEEVG